MGLSFGTKWTGDESGATAVEFAMVALPVVYLLLGIIEMSMMFVGMSTLDYATSEAARLIRTGQVQQASGDPEDLFKDALCDSAKVFLDCSKIQYEVVHLTGFSDFASHAASFDEDGNLESEGFDAGSVNDVVLIRSVYNYKLMTPLMAEFMADGTGNTKRFISTIVLETEPYDVDLVVDEL